MSVEIIEGGDIFTSGAKSVVVPVNAVGVPGKGLALAAAKRWPDWASEYKRECHGGHVKVGQLYPHIALAMVDWPPTWVLSGVVKNHWRNPSRIAWVEGVLRDLVAFCKGVGAIEGGHLVAVPALGCGLGELDWDVVRPVAEQILTDMPRGVRVLLFAPLGGSS